jgi:hypothetical protein
MEKKIEIYVSLSSIPGREKHLIETLKSLVNQKVKPYKIYINLCEKYNRFAKEKYNFKYINKEKNFFKENKNLIRIIYSKDYGPITKLFGCLNIVKKDSNKIQYITIVDDDLIYRNNMIENIKNQIKKDLNKCFSYCVDKIEDIKVGKGADSFSLNLNFLDNIIKYYDIIIKDNNLWFYHDDFIISTYLHLMKIEIVNLKHVYNMKNNIYILNGNMSKRALQNLQGDKSPVNLNEKLRESYNKLLANNSFECIKN